MRPGRTSNKPPDFARDQLRLTISYEAAAHVILSDLKWALEPLSSRHVAPLSLYARRRDGARTALFESDPARAFGGRPARLAYACLVRVL